MTQPVYAITGSTRIRYPSDSVPGRLRVWALALGREGAVAKNVYFTEEQRWPTRSQRFGWLVVIGVAIFIVYELKLLAFEPLVGSLVLLALLGVFLAAITVQQRLTVRLGRNLDGLPGEQSVRRFWERAIQVVPLAIEGQDDQPSQPALRISYISKGLLGTLSPGRRGSRLGRRERHIAVDQIESWKNGRMPRLVWLRRANPSVFPVGTQRQAVVIVLVSGERLIVPTLIPEIFLEALAAAKADSVKKERVRTVVREEI